LNELTDAPSNKLKNTETIHDMLTGYDFRVDKSLQSIRAKCRECTNGRTSAIVECQVYDCPLHPYRLGCRPSTLQNRQESKKVAPSAGFS